VNKYQNILQMCGGSSSGLFVVVATIGNSCSVYVSEGCMFNLTSKFL